MPPRVAVPVFPGSNSEEETVRACLAVGLHATLVHWSAGAKALRGFDGYVLPGGFAYEDRIRAGAIAAHGGMMDSVVAEAQRGALVLGICNGAQILVESGLVPGTGLARRPTAAFAPNSPGGRFVCRHVYVKLSISPDRCAITTNLRADEIIPMWAAHGEGRLAAGRQELGRLQRGGHIAFRYCDRFGNLSVEATPNGSPLGAAALTNKDGNILAIMPHAERDAWTYQQRDGTVRLDARGDAAKMLAPAGGIRIFAGLARALGVKTRALGAMK
jgi:phosphoribosylformylglycinamidine synthase subunit PurQ / glutaminase